MIINALLILYILSPKIGYVDYSVIFVFLSFLLSFRYKSQIQIRIDRSISLILLLWVGTILLSIYSDLYYQDLNLFFTLKPIRQIILIVLLGIVIKINKINFERIVNIIIIASILNSLIVITQYILHILHINDSFLLFSNFNSDVLVIFRKPGTFSGYPTASMVSLFGIILMFETKLDKHMILKILIIICLIISLILTARTGFVLCILYLLYFTVKEVKNVKKLILILCSLSLLFLFLININKIGILHKDTINVMFEFIIEKKFSTRSTDSLIESYKSLPQNVSTIFIGNGLFMKSDDEHVSGIGNATVDVGFQIYFFGNGILYLFLILLLYGLYFRLSLYRLTNKKVKRLFIILYGILFLSSLKGDFLFSRGFPDQLLILTLVMYYEKKIIKNTMCDYRIRV